MSKATPSDERLISACVSFQAAHDAYSAIANQTGDLDIDSAMEAQSAPFDAREAAGIALASCTPKTFAGHIACAKTALHCCEGYVLNDPELALGYLPAGLLLAIVRHLAEATP